MRKCGAGDEVWNSGNWCSLERGGGCWRHLSHAELNTGAMGTVEGLKNKICGVVKTKDEK